MRRLFKLVAFLSVTLLLFVAVSGLAFYHLMRVGEVRGFLIDEIEQRTGFRTHLGTAELEIGWITGIVFRDLALTEPDGAHPFITADRITARVALLPLLRREVVFYEIRAERPTAQFTRAEDGRFRLLDRLLSLPFLKQRDSEFSLDLRSLTINAGDMRLVDESAAGGPRRWRVVNASFSLERLQGLGLSGFLGELTQQADPGGNVGLAFQLKGDLIHDGAKINLAAHGRLAFPQESLRLEDARWIGDLELVNFPAALVGDYLGTRLPDKSISGYLAQRVHFNGSLATSLTLKGSLEFRRLSLDLPGLFLEPLTGADGRMTFDAEWSPKRIQLTRGELRAPQIRFSLQGDMSGIGDENQRLRVTISALSAPFAALRQYLPLKIVGSEALERAITAIDAGSVEIKNGRLEMPFSLARQRDASAAEVRLEAELRDVAAKLGGDALPLRAVQGRVAVKDGTLKFADFRGAYGDSRFSHVDGTYQFLPEADRKFEVNGRGEINLSEIKAQLQARSSASAGRLISSVQELSGRAKVEVGLKGAADRPVHFNGKAMLDQARFRYGEISLGDLRGEIAFTPAEIRSERLRAQLGGSPIQIQLTVKNYASEDGRFDLAIESTGVKAGVIARLLLDAGSVQDPGVVRGNVRYGGSLRDQSRRKFTGDLDLLNVQLAVDPLLQPLRELNGAIKIDESGIDFVNLRALLVGFPVRAGGRWRFAGQPQLLFDFTAPDLDITYLISQIDPESSEFYANLVAQGKIALAKGRVKNFDFSDLKTDVSIDRRVWRLTNLAARSSGGTIAGLAAVFDRPETLGLVAEPRIESVPIQSFLKWFDATTTEMTGGVNLTGRLETVGKNDAERKERLNGEFDLRIENGTINRMRILVQILNLLDLSRWFSLQLPDLA
jgi:uncharacterized protein involved in outer membrane biogenesis